MRASNLSDRMSLCALILTTSAASSASAQCAFDPSALPPHDAAASQNLGDAVFVERTTALVGAPTDSENGPSAGAAYVYGYDAGGGWSVEQKLLASDDGFGDNFGAAVALHDDTAIIGAPFDDELGDFAGSAYIFRFNAFADEWRQEQKLLAFDGEQFDAFGTSVAIHDDFAFVGAPLESDDESFNSGSVYVYRYSSATQRWDFAQKLFVADAQIGGGFVGFSVAVDDDVLLVSAHTADYNGSGAGAVFVYRRIQQMWVFEQRLLASDGQPLDVFGVSLDMSGDAAVIGAAFDDDDGKNAGAAYVFRFDGENWAEEQKLRASDGAPGSHAGDQFGDAVSISNDTIVVGAALDDGAGEDAGAAYVYTFAEAGANPGWTLTQTLRATDAAIDEPSGDQFGGAVSVSRDAVFIGSPRADRNGRDAGETYLFAADACRADIDRADCVVDAFDLLALIENWGANGPGAALAAPTTIVDVFDLFEVFDQWGSCP